MNWLKFKARYKEGVRLFEELDKDKIAEWKMEYRGCLHFQLSICHKVIDIIMKNKHFSWLEIEKKLNYWCSYSTIRCWVSSREGYNFYDEGIIPLFSESQKNEHYDFYHNFR